MRVVAVRTDGWLVLSWTIDLLLFSFNETGVTVLVVDPLGVAVCLLVLAAIAGHHLHIVHVRMYHILTGKFPFT